jgi:hypothetical protein
MDSTIDIDWLDININITMYRKERKYPPPDQIQTRLKPESYTYIINYIT